MSLQGRISHTCLHHYLVSRRVRNTPPQLLELFVVLREQRTSQERSVTSVIIVNHLLII